MNLQTTAFEPISTRLEALLHRPINTKGHRELTVTGCGQSFVAALAIANANSDVFLKLPHLVILPDQKSALQLIEEIEFFDPNINPIYLPPFDVSPYSGLYPRHQNVTERMRWLYRAQNARPSDVFVATIESLLQKTVPFKFLSNKTLHLKAQSDLPKNFALLLTSLGYQSSSVVEDCGQFCIRGGIIDLFSAAHEQPLRLELFGETIESIRFFNPVTQRSNPESLSHAAIIPPRETLFDDDTLEQTLVKFRAQFEGRPISFTEMDEMIRSLRLKQYFQGLDFLLSCFFEKLESPIEHFSSPLVVWKIDPIGILREADNLFSQLKSDYENSTTHLIRPEIDSLYSRPDDIQWPNDGVAITLSALHTDINNDESQFEFRVSNPFDFSNLVNSLGPITPAWVNQAKEKLTAFKQAGYRIFVGAKNQNHCDRISSIVNDRLEMTALSASDFSWAKYIDQQDRDGSLIHIIARPISENLIFHEEKLIFLKDEAFLGRKQRSRSSSAHEDFQKQARRLSFGDLKPGDCIVHIQHGIGVYDGLKTMDINGIPSEFIQLSYKDKDKLYLPVYRIGQIQKFSGSAASTVLDKLGGTAWEKTKTKVKSQLRDLSAELLKLYAIRSQMHRPPFEGPNEEYLAFESTFPYEETDDQLKAISDLISDMTSTKPMDRLICGDVGFGKTEVAMRAAFRAFHCRKQVAVLAPTTVLSFQHFETFKKRFAGWPIDIRELNRFVSSTDTKKTILELKSGRVDLVIGTHRLLSKDIEFHNLGLLIIDEEQKFGVAHKERIKKLKNSVDTLTLSATPIPRTLNMSFVGIRDLSLINTPPIDRLPTRTFVCKFEPETIRKAIQLELKRGGQIYFIHNRIQSIYGLADELREIAPEARIKVAHGQMDEGQLEETMVAFFKGEVDMLVCTAIVESGMDVPRANTMFIDNAQMFGLSQLYQLRGRVGRSKERAYCYLLLPRGRQIEKDAQERLKIIQENTALGSGIRIAQYDLELRGSGNILGEEQSGQIEAVGYEMYMDLLNQSLAEAKGEDLDSGNVEPDINLRIPALIPDSYIGDIRMRLGYYKSLSEISSSDELDDIEEELKDQFGPLPEPVINLMGIMLIRSLCKKLGIRDVGAGIKTLSLVFTPKTPIKPEFVIQLAMRQNKKYSVTPDSRLNIRMNTISWPNVYDELKFLAQQSGLEKLIR